jgi:hypothetical protein
MGVQVGMAHKVGLDLGTTLIVSGVWNIASGALFGIPMAVQPMKTIAALTIAGSIDLESVRFRVHCLPAAAPYTTAINSAVVAPHEGMRA